MLVVISHSIAVIKLPPLELHLSICSCRAFKIDLTINCYDSYNKEAVHTKNSNLVKSSRGMMQSFYCLPKTAHLTLVKRFLLRNILF